jgi:catechol 2,3-dioxygenase-like lactoylglutathione lyase family enzyme
MIPRLEHANLSVRDIDATLKFLQAAMPELRLRHDATGGRGRRWVHVGTEDSYLALCEAVSDASAPPGSAGLEHLGFEVADVAAVRDRLIAAGYEESEPPVQHAYRTRIYFRDADGNEWEFVEYRSDVPAERNDYLLPDGASASTRFSSMAKKHRIHSSAS